MSVRQAANDITLPTLVAASIVNPIYEELFLCGYIVTALKDRVGFWSAVNTSIAIRLVCHLYMGGKAALFILPLGFVFTYYYARSNRLWPLVIAHAVIDALGLLQYLGNS
jgi:membrane protease YdiL (CAAX protease family)